MVLGEILWNISEVIHLVANNKLRITNVHQALDISNMLYDVKGV